MTSRSPRVPTSSPLLADAAIGGVSRIHSLQARMVGSRGVNVTDQPMARRVA